MKKTIIKEFFWLAGCLLTAWLLYNFIFGAGARDIEMHDTYIIGGGFSGNPHPVVFMLAYFLMLGCCIYLIRVLYTGFKDMVINGFLLVFAGLCICLFSDIVFAIHFPTFSPAPAETTPSSTAPVTGLFYGGDSSPIGNFWVGGAIKMLLAFILAFTGFKMGRNWSKTPGQVD